jgi:hypothetical protein
MRRSAIATCALLVLLLASFVSEAGARRTKRPKCPKLGSHVIAADPQAEVYEANGEFEPEMFACAFANGHPYTLGPKITSGTSSGGGGTEMVTLSGSMVAYEEVAIVYEVSSRWTMFVRDLKTGRVLHKAASMGGFVQSVVLKSDGSVAWIVGTGGQPPEYAVISIDKTGSHTLASGTGIGPSSLALAGSTLYWTQSGKPFSAALN